MQIRVTSSLILLLTNQFIGQVQVGLTQQVPQYKQKAVTSIAAFNQKGIKLWNIYMK